MIWIIVDDETRVYVVDHYRVLLQCIGVLMCVREECVDGDHSHEVCVSGVQNGKRSTHSADRCHMERISANTDLHSNYLSTAAKFNDEEWNEHNVLISHSFKHSHNLTPAEVLSQQPLFSCEGDRYKLLKQKCPN